MNDDKKEIRHISEANMELRIIETEAGNTLVGYPIRFNVWSEDLGGFRERIRPDAAKTALMSSDIRMLYDHSTNHIPLGRIPKTLRFATDTRGVKIENDLPDTQLARDLKISIQRKDVDGMSFGFTVAEDGDEWYEKDGVVSRTINEFKEFFDFSVVIFPAYKQSKVSVRALNKCKEFRACDPAIAMRDEQANLEIQMIDYY